MAAPHIKETESRRASFEARRAELLAAGYSEQERTITIIQANIYALITAGPLALLCLALYLWRWGWGYWSPSGVLLALGGFIICIPLHELLHGLTWGLCSKGGFKSIRFGFMRQYLTPYCHCREALPWGAYLAGALTPLVVLGLGVFIWAWATGSTALLLLALFNIIAAGGDTTIAWMLRRHRWDIMLDHPEKCGFIAMARPK